MEPTGCWYSRGYLPHFDAPGLIQTVTFRLADAISYKTAHAAEELGRKLGKWARRKQIEACLDKGHGRCWLSDPRIAELVQTSLLFFDCERYRLIEWVIMPNHVHAILELLGDWRLKRVLYSLKSFTAKEALKILRESPPFWQPESFDRFVRDERHFQNAVEYVRNNPVAAGLAETPEDWPYSSAFVKRLSR